MIRYEDNSISFEEADLQQFSDESGDRNPLHMKERYAQTTVYGERVVFGMLGAITLLKEYNVDTKQIDIKFNMPLFLNRRYYYAKEEKRGVIFLYLTENGNKLISIKIDAKEVKKEENVACEVKRILPMLSSALLLSDKDLNEQCGIEGEYEIQAVNDLECVNQREYLYHILRFCSYAVGMISPGERALFIQASVSLKHIPEKLSKMSYRISKLNYNETLGIIENMIEIFCADTLVAICKVQAYIRAKFSLETVDERKLSDEHQGKVVMIIGGTKGIGAEIAKSYVSSGANVILTYYHSEDKAIELFDYLRSISDKVELVRKDMSNYEDCRNLRQYLEKKYNAIDRLFLCAALPSRNLEFYPETYPVFENYINEGIRIFYYPFLTFQSLVAEQGKIIVFSSIAVVQKKEASKMLDYICVKSMVESIVECSYYKNKDRKEYYVVRPPKMLTEMNNTPIGRMGALKPDVIAKQMLKEVEKTIVGKERYYTIEFHNSHID